MADDDHHVGVRQFGTDFAPVRFYGFDALVVEYRLVKVKHGGADDPDAREDAGSIALQYLDFRNRFDGIFTAVVAGTTTQ